MREFNISFKSTSLTWKASDQRWTEQQQVRLLQRASPTSPLANLEGEPRISHGDTRAGSEADEEVSGNHSTLGNTAPLLRNRATRHSLKEDAPN